ncbi:MAG: bifunctional phosphopantothenoylcysteine decarboxylase/phosphopantothenate--cysteine ligase CoaBC [Lacunisphaera sp.]|nr:bifunctional phosphopantothenoylcysteine decarboxylase/phosphopantothenate--cysteine ligase CoaBC [Lacunisphaera sp.]
MSGSNLLFILTGSVACYKACDAVSRLVKFGHRVRVVATASALRFIGAPTLEGLTGSPVLSDLWAPGRALDHIELTRWADAVIVCPATAHTLNRFAAGLADDLVGALFLAHDRTKPWLVAPAMNPAMWSHPATQASVEKLRSWDIHFLPVGEGRTACGETGEGRLAEPDLIVATIEAALARPARRLHVLITSGGTAEPLDGVRVLTNSSTGRTGALLAEHFIRCGHEVVMLRAEQSTAAPPLCRAENFTSFADLDAALARLLGAEHFDTVLHAAAVSDFAIHSLFQEGVKQPFSRTKIASGVPLRLELTPQAKLVDQLRPRSRNPNITVVAFKLTQGVEAALVLMEVQSLLAHSRADFVVHNDYTQRGEGMDAFPATIYSAEAHRLAQCATRTELAAALERMLSAQPIQA